jgi:hypothetical protein
MQHRKYNRTLCIATILATSITRSILVQCAAPIVNSHSAYHLGIHALEQAVPHARESPAPAEILHGRFRITLQEMSLKLSDSLVCINSKRAADERGLLTSVLLTSADGKAHAMPGLSAMGAWCVLKCAMSLSAVCIQMPGNITEEE